MPPSLHRCLDVFRMLESPPFLPNEPTVAPGSTLREKIKTKPHIFEAVGCCGSFRPWEFTNCGLPAAFVPLAFLKSQDLLSHLDKPTSH